MPPPDVPPLALCHVCSVCGRMRSAGYHRHHPIIPGQASISTPCRRCKKKAKQAKEKREHEKEMEEKKREEETRKAKEPSRRIIIEVRDNDDDDRTRGRTRERNDSPPRIIYRSVSHYRTTRDVSPEPSPPPAPRHRARSEVRFRSPSPPQDDVRYYNRRDEAYERSRSPSPDARARLSSHPSPFRSFTPIVEQIPGSFPMEPSSPIRGPRRSILKTPSEFFEYPSRHAVDTSYDSMEPEVGANRVQFVSEPLHSEHYQSRCVCKGNVCVCEDKYAYRRRSQHYYERGHIEELPRSPSPPIQRFERMIVRDDSQPARPYIRDRSHPRRCEAEEHRIRYVHSEDRPIEEWRQASAKPLPPPSEDHRRTHQSRAVSREPSPARKAARGLQEIGHKITRAYSRSPSPLPRRRYDDSNDDATDSGSEASERAHFSNMRPRTAVEPAISRGFAAGYKD